jgi:hypothetical protein
VPSDQLLHLTGARLILRDKVLLAVMTQDASQQVTAWKDVDKAAAELTRRRRAYDRHVREVCKNAGELRGGS